MITQILICDPDAVGRPSRSSPWAPNVSRLDYEDVDNELLSRLWRILNVDESGASLQSEELLIWPDTFPMVFRLPDDLTHRLSVLKAHELDDAAARWAADDDAQVEGLTLESAKKGLLELSDFAGRASEAGLPLVLAIYA